MSDSTKQVASEPLTTLHVFKTPAVFDKGSIELTRLDLAFRPYNPFQDGGIYISVNPTDPAKLFGGQWEKLDEGRVLIGANEQYPAGSKGGEFTHTLTSSEMPNHSHSGSTYSTGSHHHGTSWGEWRDSRYGTYTSSKRERGSPNYDFNNQDYATTYTGSHSHSISVNATGGNQSHNNMQPYLAVYMWVCVSTEPTISVVENLNVIDIPNTISNLTELNLFKTSSALQSNQNSLTANSVIISPTSPFPIGYIYMSMNSNDPALEFGGKWERLNDGRLLIGCNDTYPVNSKGGYEAHRLSESELPSHSHTGSTNSTGSHEHGTSWGEESGWLPNAPHGVYSSSSGIGLRATSSGNIGTSYEFDTSSNGSHSHSISVSSSGSNQPHNNMQPYLAVCMWKRIE